MTKPRMPGKAQIVIDVTIENDLIHLTVTSRPMIPMLSIVELLDRAAEELRNGRLESLQINPMKANE